MSLKVIVVDDEDGMRFILKKAISKIADIEVIGEASDGKSAINLFEKLKPDGVFMDVEMPDMDGIEVAKLMLDIQPKIMIVFITAHQQYMPQAFELYAFDYMVKPFKLERLKQTVQRMIVISSPKNKTLLIKNREETAILDQDKIILIQRENRSTVIVTSTGRHITTQTLSELEEKLNYDIFIRSHKSYIINKKKIKRMLPYGRWTCIVQFDGIDEDALITSEKAKELKNNINGD